MSDKAKIAELVEKYRYEADKSSLSEADVRANYIDWLFFYLGWDVWGKDLFPATRYHREGYQRGAGIIDVGLEIGGESVLILEAKRFGAIPRSTERSGDRTPEEKQLFRYARSRKIPYGILTNFERLHIFNADHERLISAFDDPQEYLDRFSGLERLFPDKVKAGSLPAWERQLEIKDIDETFLASMRNWRLRLANAIYEHNADNPALRTNGDFDFAKLMAAVQRLLDRLILVRYADDKEVLLTYDILEIILSGYHKRGDYAREDYLMRELIDLSYNMDEHHNTTLFQRGHICEQVFITNEALASVIEEMNNISFRKFTSDILGNTYESYLGTKLILRNGKIESEERRDIRKSGGIYYTPTWVVRYIVDRTLGTLLRQIEEKYGLKAIEKARSIKVLDPACGSGSFLIYAYQVFADFYRRLNKAIAGKQMELLASGEAAEMFRRLEAFKDLPQPVLDYPQRILKEHLYGVDIDPEAAEIAAVNLTMQAFADTKREKLPLILNENIKVGNSLISGTEEELHGYFGDKWREKKPFNWEEEFPEIMAESGFDVVTGNPPYGADFDEADRSYIEAHYPYSKSNKNSAMVFIERGLSLTKQNGFFSYIIPKSLAFSQKWASGRKLILDKLGKVYDASRAFKEVLLEQMIIVVSENFLPQDSYESVSLDKDGKEVHTYIPKQTSDITDSFPFGATESELAILQKMTSSGLFMKDISKTARGLPFQKYVSREASGIPIYRGDHIARYTLYETNETLPEAVLTRAKEKVSFLHQPKILSQRIVAHILHPADHIILMSTLDKEEILTLDTVENTVLSDDRFAYSFILALLNSELWSWYAYRFIFSKAIRTMDLDGYYLGKFPLPNIKFNSPKAKRKHDNLTALADRMLELNKRLAPIRKASSPERDGLVQEIELTDRAIDRLVYDLYQLTDGEIRMIEEASFAENYAKLPSLNQAQALAEKHTASQKR